MDEKLREKVVGYTRVSTVKQLSGTSIQVQEESIKRYCEAYNLDLRHIYKDEGVSAYKDRPQYDTMLEKVYKDDSIKGVVVSDLTRFGRSTIDLLTEIKRLDINRKKFISVKDNFDISTKNGRLLLGMLSLIADYEKETIMERMTAGREKAKLDGTKSGKPMHRPKAEIDWNVVRDLRKVGLSWTKTAKQVGVSCPTLIKRAMTEGIT